MFHNCITCQTAFTYEHALLHGEIVSSNYHKTRDDTCVLGRDYQTESHRVVHDEFQGVRTCFGCLNHVFTCYPDEDGSNDSNPSCLKCGGCNMWFCAQCCYLYGFNSDPEGNVYSFRGMCPSCASGQDIEWV